jgi:hypothetical protein
MSASCIQIAATLLQLVGGCVGGYGAWRAWNRISVLPDKLWNIVVSDLKDAAQLYTGDKEGRAFVYPQVHGGGQLGTPTTEVEMPGTPEERLKLLENLVAKLPGQIAEKIESALAEDKTRERLVLLKDKSLALEPPR